MVKNVSREGEVPGSMCHLLKIPGLALRVKNVPLVKIPRLAGRWPVRPSLEFFFSIFLEFCKSLCRASNLAHGKVLHGLCRLVFAVCSLPCATHGKVFIVCKSAFAMFFYIWQITNLA